MTEVKIKTRKDENHRIISPSGVWGGVTPYGMIYFDLFVEIPETPRETIITIDEATGQRTESVDESIEPSIERIALTGVMARPEIARAIGRWLIEKSDEAEILSRQDDKAAGLIN